MAISPTAIPAEPCRVLHIIDSLGLGGAQSILKAYLETLNASRDVHYLYALRSVPNQIVIENTKTFTDPSPTRFSPVPLLRLRRFIREHRIAVLHCHLFRSQGFGYLLKRLFYPGIALIFHEHGRVVSREGESPAEAYAFHMLLKAASRSVDAFICISDFARTRLLEVVPSAAARTVVVPNPIRRPQSHMPKNEIEAARRNLGIPPDSFVVGFAGRIVKRKGWRDFLSAMQLLAPRVPIFYLLAGDGEERDAVEKMVNSPGLQFCGRVLGHVHQMDRFYQVLDCLVMPSHWEPHGLSQLEAQSYGVPVVVSNVPGLADTVHENQDALLFRAGDVNALADRVLEIVTNPVLRSRLSARGRENASRFSVNTFSDGIGSIYSALCNDRTNVGS